MKWLRRIIAEEVSKVEGRLTSERDLFASFISIHTKTVANSLEAEVTKLLHEFENKVSGEVAEVVAEKNQLVAELKSRLAEAEQALASLKDTASKFSHWRAEPDTVQADQDLQKVK